MRRALPGSEGASREQASDETPDRNCKEENQGQGTIDSLVASWKESYVFAPEPMHSELSPHSNLDWNPREFIPPFPVLPLAYWDRFVHVIPNLLTSYPCKR